MAVDEQDGGNQRDLLLQLGDAERSLSPIYKQKSSKVVTLPQQKWTSKQALHDNWTGGDCLHQ